MVPTLNTGVLHGVSMFYELNRGIRLKQSAKIGRILNLSGQRTLETNCFICS